MSLTFLPLPLFLVICFTVSIILLYVAIKRRNIDRKGLLVLYFTIAIGAILSAILQILKDTTIIYNKYYNNIGYIMLVYLVIVLVELLFLSLTHRGNDKTKKMILLGWGFILVPILLALIVYFILD